MDGTDEPAVFGQIEGGNAISLLTSIKQSNNHLKTGTGRSPYSEDAFLSFSPLTRVQRVCDRDRARGAPILAKKKSAST
jgi:hypothetical protein